MKLHDLSPAAGSKKKKRRVGRGNGSGNGTTAGKGHKGLNARSGGGSRPGFEGGQMPIQRRLPKRGFTNPSRTVAAVVNIGDLDRFEANQIIDESLLRASGLANGPFDFIKILGNGELMKPFEIRIEQISKGAREKIEKAGGRIATIEL